MFSVATGFFILCTHTLANTASLVSQPAKRPAAAAENPRFLLLSSMFSWISYLILKSFAITNRIFLKTVEKRNTFACFMKSCVLMYMQGFFQATSEKSKLHLFRICLMGVRHVSII